MKTKIGTAALACLCVMGSLSLLHAADSGTFEDGRDGRVYKWVRIGDQIWMGENLNYTPRTNRGDLETRGSRCPGIGVLEGEAERTQPGDCGLYYDWVVAMDLLEENWKDTTYCKRRVPDNLIRSPHRGIGPEGWHIPTSKEVAQLIAHLGGSEQAAAALRSRDGWKSPGTNASGFDAKPTGVMFVP
jgi:uncharacterized protein (TIGR02145 family)